MTTLSSVSYRTITFSLTKHGIIACASQYATQQRSSTPFFSTEAIALREKGDVSMKHMYLKSVNSVRRRLLARLRRNRQSRRYAQVLAEQYLQAALAQATLKQLEDGLYYSEIPGFQGVYGYGDTEAIARTDVAEALEAWVQFRLEEGLELPGISSARRVTPEMANASC